MNYLLDKKIKKNRVWKISLSVLAIIILFYFRSGVFTGLSGFAGGIFRPVLVIGNNVGEKIKNVGAYFASKNSLNSENQNLKLQLNENEARIANYNALSAENESLKEILGRKKENTKMILAGILAKPNQSIYDTLLVDVGSGDHVSQGDVVFAKGNVPIGRVESVYEHSSKIILYSNPGEKTPGFIGNTQMEIVGRGGGNFEMVLPRDLNPQKGDQVLLPGANPYVLAIVEGVISDPRDPFTKALLSSPVNIQEIKFVEVQNNI